MHRIFTRNAVPFALSLAASLFVTSPAAAALSCHDLSASLLAIAPLYDAEGLPVTGMLRIREEERVPGQLPAVEVTLIGPELGSMDQTSVIPSLTCLPGDAGVELRVTIVRAADYHGAALKNVVWHPRLLLRLSAQRTTLRLSVNWRLRLSSGAKVLDGGGLTFPARSEYLIPLLAQH